VAEGPDQLMHFHITYIPEQGRGLTKPLPLYPTAHQLYNASPLLARKQSIQAHAQQRNYALLARAQHYGALHLRPHTHDASLHGLVRRRPAAALPRFWGSAQSLVGSRQHSLPLPHTPAQEAEGTVARPTPSIPPDHVPHICLTTRLLWLAASLGPGAPTQEHAVPAHMGKGRGAAE